MKGIVIALFVALLAGSLYFARERMLFSDASFILFRIINLNSLQIQEHRYGSFITQVFPLFAVRLHLPLSWIVMLYSASFHLFYLGVAALLLLRFKDHSLAVLMAFYYILFVSDTYFWSNNEIHQGIAWMFVFFGIIFSLGRQRAPLSITIPAFLVLSALCIYTHPLVLFPTVFLWLFFLLQKESWPFNRKETVVLTALLFLVCISKVIVSVKGSGYDAQKLTTATHHTLKDLIDACTSPMVKEMIRRMLTNYWLVPMLFLTGLYTAFRRKRLKPALLVIIFCVIYSLAVCLTFTDFIPSYTESEWMPLTIIVTAPFVYYCLPHIRRQHAVLLLAVIFAIRLVYIGMASKKFTERKEWLQTNLHSMRQQHIQKGILYENEENKRILIMNWGVPVESLILSALQGDHPNRTFVVDTKERIEQRPPADNHTMISPFELWSYRALNDRYFKIDTLEVYRLINIHYQGGLHPKH